MVPSTPASLLNPARRAASVMTGAGSSTPTSAHVPVQTKAKPSSSAGTPATAAAVSCEGPTITCGGRARPRSATAGPATSPAARSGGNIFIGTASASPIWSAHFITRVSSSPVVEALVSSVPSCPDSQ